jgi:hypothetical protein
MASVHESALVVLVPEAEAAAGPCRGLHDPAAAVGVPAHVTILYPFKPPATVTAEDLDALRDLFARYPRFDFTLAELRRFPGVLYLAPEPADPFNALTEAVVALYPETPPYGGAYAEVIPHLTLAQPADPAQVDEIEAEFRRTCARNLPVRATVTEVVLMDNAQHVWQVRAAFPLGLELRDAIPAQVAAFLADASPPVRAIALAARSLVRDVAPDLIEQVDAPGKLLGYGWAPTCADTVCVIMPLKSGVNLGFARGAELPDPAGLLRGTGQRARHVRLETADDVARPEVRALVAAAVELSARRRKEFADG